VFSRSLGEAMCEIWIYHFSLWEIQLRISVYVEYTCRKYREAPKMGDLLLQNGRGKGNSSWRFSLAKLPASFLDERCYRSVKHYDQTFWIIRTVTLFCVREKGLQFRRCRLPSLLSLPAKGSISASCRRAALVHRPAPT